MADKMNRDLEYGIDFVSVSDPRYRQGKPFRSTPQKAPIYKKNTSFWYKKQKKSIVKSFFAFFKK